MPFRHISHSHIPPGRTGNPTSLADAKHAISSALLTTVQRISQHTMNLNHPSQLTSVYIGLSGIALMQHHLSNLPLPILSKPELSLASDQALLASLHTALQRGLKAPSPSHASFLETDIGVATLVLLRIIDPTPNPAQEEPSELPFLSHWKPCAQLLRRAVAQVGEAEDDGCEVLYGRAGLLYALLRIRAGLARVLDVPGGAVEEDERAPVIAALAGVAGDEAVVKVVEAIVELGRTEAREYASLVSSGYSGMEYVGAAPPLMWAWHGKRYLGAAHGVAGILHVLWNCPRRFVEKYEREMVRTLEFLVDLQDASGNWPPKAPDGYNPRHENELIQWCHGASGIVIFLSTTLRHDPDTINLDPRMRTLVKRSINAGANLVHRHGLLKKGIGVCHGVAGSVQALLAASYVLDTATTGNLKESSWHLQQAVHLAYLATRYEELTGSGQMRVPERPWSLYEGAAGMCCAWANVLCRMEGGGVGRGLPGFDDL